MNMNQKICKSEVIHTFMIVEMWKSTLRNTHKTEKSKLTSHKLKEEVRFILKMHYSSEQKKSDK